MRAIFGIILLFLSAMAASAQTEVLRMLETGDDGRDWEAVGRLDLAGRGFCTGALIAPDLVLTAAHCLFDKRTGGRIDHEQVEFLAGWRNGRASAYRHVRRAVVHPDYRFESSTSPRRVRNDIALLELQHPVRNTTIVPFETAEIPGAGDRVGVVSYARDRSEAPALQETCTVRARQEGVLIMSCDVDFGASGSPVFHFGEGRPRIVSVVSAKAMVDGAPVSLGTSLQEPLATLRRELAAGRGFAPSVPGAITRLSAGGMRRETGAKFIRPGG